MRRVCVWFWFFLADVRRLEGNSLGLYVTFHAPWRILTAINAGGGDLAQMGGHFAHLGWKPG